MSVSAEEALRRLEAGNRRFRQGRPETGQSGEGGSRFVDLSSGQEPFAAVLGCSDSRVPVEMIFDQGPGRLFVVRVAGHVVGPTGIGSLEFAVKELGVPLLLVFGHTGCGAIAASLAPKPRAGSEYITDNLGEITGRISMSLHAWGQTVSTGNKPSSEEVERFHVREVVRALVRQSDLVADAVQAGELHIVGSIYDLKTGHVEFFEEASAPIGGDLPVGAVGD
ncbi:MAG: carbonic anhydrase [Gemmatimonadota bacterium]